MSSVDLFVSLVLDANRGRNFLLGTGGRLPGRDDFRAEMIFSLLSSTMFIRLSVLDEFIISPSVELKIGKTFTVNYHNINQILSML